MKLKKYFISCMALVMCFALTACNGGNTDNSPKETLTSGEALDTKEEKLNSTAVEKRVQEIYQEVKWQVRRWFFRFLTPANLGYGTVM